MLNSYTFSNSQNKENLQQTETIPASDPEREKGARERLITHRYSLGSKEAVDEEGAEGGERHAGPDRAEPCSRRGMDMDTGREANKAAYSMMRRPKI